MDELSRSALLRSLFGKTPFFGGETLGPMTPIKESLVLTALVSLVAADEPVRVLEVGSWTGWTALTWAHAIDKAGNVGGRYCVLTLGGHSLPMPIWLAVSRCMDA